MIDSDEHDQIHGHGASATDIRGWCETWIQFFSGTFKFIFETSIDETWSR